MIPRIFHQIWVGPDRFPEEFARYQASWLDHHPDWKLCFWTEDHLPQRVQRPEVLERLRTPAERSDVLRLDVLHQFGGVYMDTDFECCRNLDDLIEEVDFFVADLKPGRPNNAIIGSIPGHEILAQGIHQAVFREFFGYDKAGTGPLAFNRVLEPHREKIRVFPPAAFYPATPTEREEAIAIHHAARSWQTIEGFKQATLRAEQRLARAQRELDQTKGRLVKAEQRLVKAEQRLAKASTRSPMLRLRRIVASRRR